MVIVSFSCPQYLQCRYTNDISLVCERFAVLPFDKKQMIAAELDRSIREVERKIADMRTRVAY